jgi:anti-sigma regulatory factor (Ser/Thr protein kinase)
LGTEDCVNATRDVDVGCDRPGHPSAVAPTARRKAPMRYATRHTRDSQRLMRTEARTFLAEAMVPDRRVEDVILVLTELVMNGCDAAAMSAPVSTIVSVDKTITIEVINRRHTDSPDVTLPDTLAMPASDAERGRGLALVSMLAARLSIETTPLLTVLRAEMLR